MVVVIASGIGLTLRQWCRPHRFHGRMGDAARDAFGADQDFALVGSGNLRDSPSLSPLPQPPAETARPLERLLGHYLVE